MNRIKVALGVLLGKGAPYSISDPNHPRNRGEESFAGEGVTESSVLAISAAWACINLLVGTQASLPLMVYKTDRNGVRTVANEHPLYRVLHDSPNSQQTALDFWEFECGSIEMRGNAYARKIKSGEQVIGLVPVFADVMSVRRLAGNRIGYSWTHDGRSFDLTDADVLHIRGFGGNPMGGLSTLAFGRNTFGLAQAIDHAAGGMFRNGMRPGGVMTFEKFLTDPQRDIVERKLIEKFVGAVNAGRPMVLEGGTTWQQLSLNPEDAQMLQSRSFSVEEICRLFGVPPFMIGHNEKASGYPTSLEQQVLMFQKFSLRRRLARIEQALRKQLLTDQDRADGIVIEFNLEGLLRGDSAGRSAFYGSALDKGWMTINEVRALENLPPVPGGDVPRMQSQNVPITTAHPLKGHNGGPALVEGE